MAIGRERRLLEIQNKPPESAIPAFVIRAPNSTPIKTRKIAIFLKRF